MNELSNCKLTNNAKKLRRDMTKEERRLWYDFLKTLPITVNRQKVIGPYIVDFYIAAAHLIIELDGSQHYEKEGLAADKLREAFFKSQGMNVIRYPNRDVTYNFSGICQDIIHHLHSVKAISLKYTESLPLEGKVPRRGG